MCNKRKLIRISPSMFDEDPIMIGRNKNDKIWKKFKWNEKNDLNWEYCPLSDMNEHLIGTTDDYNELEENSSNSDIDTKDTEKVCEFIDNLNGYQLGLCAIYASYKYSHLINNNFVTLADNNISTIVNIMCDDEFNKYIDFVNNSMSQNKKNADGEKV